MAWLDPEVLGDLAALTTVSRYAPPAEDVLDAEAVERAVAVVRDVERTVTKRIDRRTKVRQALDPRATARRA
jgi:hypothetical protein